MIIFNLVTVLVTALGTQIKAWEEMLTDPILPSVSACLHLHLRPYYLPYKYFHGNK